MNTSLYTRIISTFTELASDAPTIQTNTTVLATPILLGSALPANLYGYSVYNPNTVNVFLKFYNKAVSPTVGTDTPVFTIQVPADGSVMIWGTDVISNFSLKMYFCATTGYLLTDTVAPALALYCTLGFKQ